jgi:outer membrane protein
MKNISLALNGILLIAVIVLYVLFFKQKSTAGTSPVAKVPVATAPIGSGNGIRIAYFNMDSLEKHYNYIKDTRSQLKSQEQGISNELENLKKNYMTRVNALQQKAQSMSQQEGEAAQSEINQMQVSYQQREAQLTQELQDKQFKSMQDISKKIEDFLKTYNQEKAYAFIFSHQPGDFIYYTDSVYNITNDIVEGLNASYKKDK